MRFLILLPCFVFTFLTFYSSVSYGFSYDIDSFTVTSGGSSFVDNFDDGVAPPSGPNGSSTYFVSSPLSSGVESNGILTLDSNDAITIGDETFIDVFLLDYFSLGIGGSIEGKFNFSNGFTPNTGFKIEIVSPQTNGVSLFINSSSGSIFAEVVSEGNGQGVIESETDISNSLIGITDITLKLDISAQNVVTALLDYGSDGVYDITLPGTGILLGTANFAVGFAAEEFVPDPVPEPATIALLGIGLAWLAGGAVRRKLKKTKQ